MNDNELLITLAEIEVAFRFHFKGTGMLFRSYESKKDREHYTGPFLSADFHLIREYRDEQKCSWEFAEYCRLLEVTGDYLTTKNMALFHGVAFLHGQGAYILTAPSGTGKSTQFRNLKTLYGDQCEIINGDKPILAYDPEGNFRVYPSPWKGKEGWEGFLSAPLRGIIFLEQGKENTLSKLEPAEAVLLIMVQFLFTAPDRNSVHTVCRMADDVLHKIPLYRLVNRGDFESSGMVFDLVRSIERQ